MKRRSCDLSGCLTGQSSKICPSDLTHQNRYNEKVVEYSANGMMKRFQRRGLKSNAQVSDTLQAYGTNDAHKPAHAHVKGKGHEVRIGPNGKIKG